MSTIAAAPTWLDTFDPGSPGSIASSLDSLLSPAAGDPANSSSPAGFDVLQPASAAAGASSSSALSSYQQALDALTVASDTFLIQSALGSATASSTDSVSAALQAAEQEQASERSTQSQAALAAAQAAVGSGQTIDTTA